HTVRRPDQDWFVQWAAVSEDSDEAVLTYHGRDTTGADLIPLDASAGNASTRPSYVGEVHGAVEAHRGGFIAATGADLIELDEATEPLGARADNMHLMQFGLDEGAAYVASCGERPAVHRTELATGSLRRTETGGYCGEVLGVVDGRYLALGSTPADRYGFPATTTYRLRLIDLDRGGAGTPLGDGVVRAVLADPGAPG
ncbi:MAG: hypothetical protein M3Y34_07010, partial [Actinomycetota bacterium]|nr:hypothetical protein [Actinomycetota bacterium]